MYKKLLICGLAFICLLAGCKQAADKTTVSAGSSAGSWLFYTTADGLYRADFNGSEQKLIKSGGALRYIGSLSGWVYFTDEDNRLLKTDANGQREEAVSGGPALDAIMAGGMLCYVEANKIIGLDADGHAKPLADIPQDILELPFNLKTDGIGLFICTYGEQGDGSVYRCDLAKGRIDMPAANVHSAPFAISDNQAIQVTDTGTDNQIFKQSLVTGEKQVLLSYTGFLYDMCVSGDWLFYITQPNEGGSTYMNGFHLRTGETFQLSAPGDHICQTLAGEILIMNSQDQSISRFMFDSGAPAFLCVS